MGHKSIFTPNLINITLCNNFTAGAPCNDVAPVAETGFSHRLTTYKIVGHLFGLSYLNISGNNQVKIVFLESVTFQFHAHVLSSEVAQTLKSYGHLSNLGVALSHRHGDFLG